MANELTVGPPVVWEGRGSDLREENSRCQVQGTGIQKVGREWGRKGGWARGRTRAWKAGPGCEETRRAVTLKGKTSLTGKEKRRLTGVQEFGKRSVSCWPLVGHTENSGWRGGRA